MGRKNRKWMLLRQKAVGGEGIVISYELADTFTTDKAAGAVHNTACEPGPGTRAVVDSAGTKLSLSSGSVVIAGKTVDNVDPVLSMGAVTRAAGMAMQGVWRYAASGGRARFGFGNAAGNTGIEYFRVSASVISATTFGCGTAAHATDYTVSIILRSAGAFFVISGGAFGAGHKLIWATNSDNTATLYANIGISDADSASSASEIKAAQLGGPWVSAYGPGALHTSGNIAASTAFTHEANFLGYFTLTNNGSAGDTVIKFRVQDATNYWKLTIGNDGAADLSEVVAGAATSRGTAAAGVFADGERCAILANGQNIRIFDGGASRISYASAASFETATAGEFTSLATDAVLANFELYPVDLSGAALGWVTALAVPL